MEAGLVEQVVQQVPATTRNVPPALMPGFNPVAQATAPVSPIDGVASNGSRQCPFQPNAEIGSEIRFELRRRA
jgi:hypothetical protein